jgi:glycosyltransferase involved in cell wall biosynthesis
MQRSLGICLNMIVKDEAHVIERCLVSVRAFIDTWVIVDTGSTDGTQQRIRALLQAVPGSLCERPWRGFAENRNEAMELARYVAEYSMVMDADEELIAEPDFCMPRLTADAYLVANHIFAPGKPRC